MKSVTVAAIAALSLLAGMVAASPKKHSGDYDGDWYHKGEKGCLSKGDVAELTAAYRRLLGAFDPADLAYLSDDWVDSSQSIATFLNVDPPADASPVVFTKPAFAGAQANNPPLAVAIIGEPVVDCKSFAFKWSAAFGQANKTVRGFTFVEAEPGKKYKKKPVMTRWDVEFNSLLWAINQGGYYCVNGRSGPHSFGTNTCPA